MDDGNRIWILLSRRISGTISPEEKIELEELLMQDPEAWYTMEVLDGIAKGEEIPPELVDEIKLLLQGGNRAALGDIMGGTPRRRHPNWVRFAGIAAAITVLVVVTGAFVYFLGWNESAESSKAMHEVVSPNGTRITHTMPDGTRIRLNAGSKIAYEKSNASLQTREVFLTGEAYFEVVYDEHRPFVVQTPDFTIRNLGTSFNVKSYPDDEIVETALIEGAIKITLKGDTNKSFIMKPNEKLVLYRREEALPEGNRLTASLPDTHPDYEIMPVTIDKHSAEVAETAWLHDKIAFKQESFDALTKKIARKFNVTVQIEDEEIRNEQVTGKFEDEDLEASLKVLQMIVPFNYTIEGNTVTISR